MLGIGELLLAYVLNGRYPCRPFKKFCVWHLGELGNCSRGVAEATFYSLPPIIYRLARGCISPEPCDLLLKYQIGRPLKGFRRIGRRRLR